MCAVQSSGQWLDLLSKQPETVENKPGRSCGVTLTASIRFYITLNIQHTQIICGYLGLATLVNYRALFCLDSLEFVTIIYYLLYMRKKFILTCFAKNCSTNSSVNIYLINWLCESTSSLMCLYHWRKKNKGQSWF